MRVKFTPWRNAYIRGASGAHASGCVLCDAGRREASPESLVLCRGAFCYILMNRYPYNPAHLMVTPYAHLGDLTTLDPASSNELFELTRASTRVIREAIQPHGFNIGMNLGKVAGAGIAAHLHMHIVPRWDGDSNFMPVIGGTRLVPEDLHDTYQRLRPLFVAYDTNNDGSST